MKKHILLLLLTFISFKTSAQNNAIKGRFGLIPTFEDGVTYGGGIGFEHLFKQHWSFQLLYNFYHFADDERFNSQISFFNQSNNHEFIPELRYYFGKKENFKSNTFLGAYTNVRIKKTNDAGLIFFDFPNPQFNFMSVKKINELCYGLLVGQNLPISKKLYLDVYFGGSINFTKEYLGFDLNDIREIRKSTNRQARVGLNLGYLF
jgi:hypothetical protein